MSFISDGESNSGKSHRNDLTAVLFLPPESSKPRDPPARGDLHLQPPGDGFQGDRQ